MPVKTTRIQVTFPISVARKIAKLAEKDHRSLSSFVQHIVETALAKMDEAS